MQITEICGYLVLWTSFPNASPLQQHFFYVLLSAQGQIQDILTPHSAKQRHEDTLSCPRQKPHLIVLGMESKLFFPQSKCWYQCWKQGELIWLWGKAIGVKSTSEGTGGCVWRIEQWVSCKFNIVENCFSSSVSCLISLRKAAFCLSKSSLSFNEGKETGYIKALESPL